MLKHASNRAIVWSMFSKNATKSRPNHPKYSEKCYSSTTDNIGINVGKE